MYHETAQLMNSRNKHPKWTWSAKICCYVKSLINRNCFENVLFLVRSFKDYWNARFYKAPRQGRPSMTSISSSSHIKVGEAVKNWDKIKGCIFRHKKWKFKKYFLKILSKYRKVHKYQLTVLWCLLKGYHVYCISVFYFQHTNSGSSRCFLK